MYTKSTIQQASELANQKNILLGIVNEYLNKYDIKNLYLEFDGKQVSSTNMIGKKDVSKIYESIEYAIQDMNKTDILYIYETDSKTEFRLLS